MNISLKDKNTLVKGAGIFGAIIILFLGFYWREILTANKEVISPSVSLPIKKQQDSSGLLDLTIGSTEIKVEIADTSEKKAVGLGYRENLPDDTGMFFQMEVRRVPRFWMKGMLIPLDIIWIDEGVVIGFEEDVPIVPVDSPNNEIPSYSPTQPVTAVLEVNAGFVKRNGIKIGDRVQLTGLEPVI
jgi:uncharacterized membrane protein (UPF0127 family)